MEKLSYNINEVCQLTGLGRNKLYDAINAGLLKRRQLGRRTVILRDDLVAFLRELPESRNGTAAKPQ